MLKINQFVFVVDVVVSSIFCWFAECTSASPFPGVVTVNSGVRPFGRPSFQLDSNGNLVICSFVEHNSTHKEVVLIHCYDPGCAHSVTNSIEIVVDHVKDCSIALTSTGLPVIAYRHRSKYDAPPYVKFAFCNDENCTSSTIRTVAHSSYLDYSPFTLALDALDCPVASYSCNKFNELCLLHCGTPHCSAGNYSIVTFSNDTWDTRVQSSIILGRDSYPVVTYTNGYGYSQPIMLVRCHDSNCKAKTIQQIANSGSPHHGSSLTLDSNDFPVVAYLSNEHKLTILHCGDETCETGNSVATQDIAIFVSSDYYYRHDILSIQMMQNGFPVVAFVTRQNKAVFILRCGDPNCQNAKTNVIREVEYAAERKVFHVSLRPDPDDYPVMVYSYSTVASKQTFRTGVNVVRYICPLKSTLSIVNGDYKCCQEGYRSSGNRHGQEVQVALDENCSSNGHEYYRMVGMEFADRSSVCVVLLLFFIYFWWIKRVKKSEKNRTKF